MAEQVKSKPADVHHALDWAIRGEKHRVLAILLYF